MLALPSIAVSGAKVLLRQGEKGKPAPPTGREGGHAAGDQRCLDLMVWKIRADKHTPSSSDNASALTQAPVLAISMKL